MERFVLRRSDTTPLEVTGQLFYAREFRGRGSRHRVRLIFDEGNGVVLSCESVATDTGRTRHMVSRHRLMEHALDELAVLPLDVVPNAVYRGLMDDLFGG